MPGGRDDVVDTSQRSILVNLFSTFSSWAMGEPGQGMGSAWEDRI